VRAGGECASLDDARCCLRFRVAMELNDREVGSVALLHRSTHRLWNVLAGARENPTYERRRAIESRARVFFRRPAVAFRCVALTETLDWTDALQSQHGLITETGLEPPHQVPPSADHRGRTVHLFLGLCAFRLCHANRRFCQGVIDSRLISRSGDDHAAAARPWVAVARAGTLDPASRACGDSSRSAPG
jgi:hypothetical protein